nr:hypothetical protein CPGR_00414 [Mycolicibacter nonchromogenicus]
MVFSPGVVTDTWVALSGSPTAMAARACVPLWVSSSISLRSGLARTAASTACRSGRYLAPSRAASY